MQSNDQYRLISLPALRQEFGITYSRTTLTTLMDAGKFPPRVKISAHCGLLWRASDLRRFVDLAAQGKPWTPADAEGVQL